jgi:hypothetical protein
LLSGFFGSRRTSVPLDVVFYVAGSIFDFACNILDFAAGLIGSSFCFEFFVASPFTDLAFDPALDVLSLALDPVLVQGCPPDCVVQTARRPVRS